MANSVLIKKKIKSFKIVLFRLTTSPALKRHVRQIDEKSKKRRPE